MTYFVSFWAKFKNGESFFGNSTVGNFEIVDDKSLAEIEEGIMKKLNENKSPYDAKWIDYLSIMNWKVL